MCLWRSVLAIVLLIIMTAMLFVSWQCQIWYSNSEKVVSGNEYIVRYWPHMMLSVFFFLGTLWCWILAVSGFGEYISNAVQFLRYNDHAFFVFKKVVRIMSLAIPHVSIYIAIQFMALKLYFACWIRLFAATQVGAHDLLLALSKGMGCSCGVKFLMHWFSHGAVPTEALCSFGAWLIVTFLLWERVEGNELWTRINFHLLVAYFHNQNQNQEEIIRH